MGGNPLSALATVDARIDSIETAMEGAATARARAEELEELAKQKLAVMFVHYRSEGKSAADADKFARASEPYRKASEEWIAANYEWRRQDAKVRATEMRFEAWRSVQSTERAKMQLR
jgi:hypothetical protein